MIVGITRVRNEALIIADTLRHVLERAQWVILYDDASTDDTAAIAEGFERVHVIRGEQWSQDRLSAETEHRKMLCSVAVANRAEWVWCFDADERLVGPMPPLDMDVAGFRLPLYDGYMAPGYDAPYVDGPLEHLPRLWGAERRDIMMVFRPERAQWIVPDQREPKMIDGMPPAFASRSHIKHFGKCLSIEHWEETCEYYARYWPGKMGAKWDARRGQAIHSESDQGGPLFEWDDLPKHCHKCFGKQQRVADIRVAGKPLRVIMRCVDCGSESVCAAKMTKI